MVLVDSKGNWEKALVSVRYLAYGKLRVVRGKKKTFIRCDSENLSQPFYFEQILKTNNSGNVSFRLVLVEVFKQICSDFVTVFNLT